MMHAHTGDRVRPVRALSTACPPSVMALLMFPPRLLSASQTSGPSTAHPALLPSPIGDVFCNSCSMGGTRHSASRAEGRAPPGGVQETLTSLLYKGGRFQFSRLESLLEQAARSPGRSTLSTPAAAHSDRPPSSALEVTHPVPPAAGLLSCRDCASEISVAPGLWCSAPVAGA